jgi:molybdopterin/thiamine biosynthesis adenylyltransferase
MDDSQLLRYSRHILLDEIGVEGQQRILDASVLVVGLGGLGSAACLYLATAGVGHLTLLDHDVVDLTNLQRQIAHTEARVGQPKVESARQAMLAINPGLTITVLQERADAARLQSLVAGVDVVLD